MIYLPESARLDLCDKQSKYQYGPEYAYGYYDGFEAALEYLKNKGHDT